VKQVRDDSTAIDPEPSWGSCPRPSTALAADDDKETCHSTEGPAAFSPVPQPATEYQKGAAIAHALVLRQIDAGHSADHIAQVQVGAQGAFDDAQANTLHQREWFAGYRDTAADIVETYKDAQLAEAELPSIEAEES